MFQRLRGLFSRSQRDKQVQEKLGALRNRLPTPMFWLFGKTQSGKTSVIRYLTGAADAQIGTGFRPCTRFSRRYLFPTTEAPLLDFLDTRGLDEAGYDPQEDLARFNNEAHVVLVVVKALDHALENVLTHLGTIRQAQPNRPVILVLTCLHEAYPQQQHPTPYPFDDSWEHTPPAPVTDLQRSLDEQRRRFARLVDRVVAIDLTPAEEGFEDPDYGGPRLREVLLEVLPGALRQTLLMLDEAKQELRGLYEQQALPYILAYSSLATSAGAVPLPVVDLVLLSAIQSRMVYDLARLYGQPLTAKRFGEIAGTLGTSVLVRQAGRGLIKWIPWIGSVAGALTCGALAGASTYALGKAFCYYYRAIHQGHVPQPDDLRRYFSSQLTQAEQIWSKPKVEAIAHPEADSSEEKKD
jgi:uncharacterized protein (DUF697 family)